MDKGGQDAAIRLEFGEAVGVLMRALGIEPAADSATRARVRQLQRMGLLARPDASAYVRFTYGLLELSMLATAFRLMSAFMLPIVAVRVLTERWHDIVPALVGGLDTEDAWSRWSEQGELSRPFLTIEGVALSRLGKKSATDSRYDGPLGAITCSTATTTLEDSLGGTTDGLILDTRSYMRGLMAELRALDVVEERIRDEVDRLRFSRLRATDQASAPLEPPSPAG